MAQICRVVNSPELFIKNADTLTSFPNLILILKQTTVSAFFTLRVVRSHSSDESLLERSARIK